MSWRIAGAVGVGSEQDIPSCFCCLIRPDSRESGRVGFFFVELVASFLRDLAPNRSPSIYRTTDSTKQIYRIMMPRPITHGPAAGTRGRHQEDPDTPASPLPAEGEVATVEPTSTPSFCEVQLRRCHGGAASRMGGGGGKGGVGSE